MSKFWTLYINIIETLGLIPKYNNLSRIEKPHSYIGLRPFVLA